MSMQYLLCLLQKATVKQFFKIKKWNLVYNSQVLIALYATDVNNFITEMM